MAGLPDYEVFEESTPDDIPIQEFHFTPEFIEPESIESIEDRTPEYTEYIEDEIPQSVSQVYYPAAVAFSSYRSSYQPSSQVVVRHFRQDVVPPIDNVPHVTPWSFDYDAVNTSGSIVIDRGEGEMQEMLANSAAAAARVTEVVGESLMNRSGVPRTDNRIGDIQIAILKQQFGMNRQIELFHKRRAEIKDKGTRQKKHKVNIPYVGESQSHNPLLVYNTRQN
jgi:hypothetical protein